MGLVVTPQILDDVVRDPAPLLVAAARLLERALILDPSNLDVVRGAANIAQDLGRMEQAAALDRYIVAHDPVNATAHGSLGFYYSRTGRLDEAIASYQTALSLNPGRVGTEYNIGEALLRKGDFEAALKAMQRESDEDWQVLGLSMVYHSLGRKAESDAALVKLIKTREREMPYNIAYALAWRGEVDRSFQWLDKAVTYRDSGLVEAFIDPLLEPLHQDARWLPFLRKLGRAPDQLAAIKFDVKLPK